MTGLTGYHAGRVAEDIVARDYTDRAHVFAAKRWRGSGGEIDLIMRNGAQVVFVEVKKSSSFAKAATRLGRRQMDRLVAAGSEFLAAEPKGQLTDVRFDLALVNGQGEVQIIENAFDVG
ncbi:MAG: YraN family protein [Yoonia sp.]|nr:YraN family protein [Yoonia sp.]